MDTEAHAIPLRHHLPPLRPADQGTLRMVSYNIQTGIETRKYRHYFTHGWKHVLPHDARQSNLERISECLRGFDLIGLQEVDSGSMRSRYINQVEALSNAMALPYWYAQVNRKLGRFAQHSNGLVSRFPLREVVEHKLPGIVPGRGALQVKLGKGQQGLSVFVVHLALSRRARLSQLDFVADLLAETPYAVVMGDFNCTSRSAEFDLLKKRTHLMEPIHDLHTFPSWRPSQNIDHILVSDGLEVKSVGVLDYPLSDHLPIMAEVVIPEGMKLGS